MAPLAPSLAVTWWGHASTTIELGGVRVATDPLLSRRLFHLRRESPAPPETATDADVVLISHLHHDHLHVPSLRRFAPDVPLVVPRGTASRVHGLTGRELVEVVPGDHVEVAGTGIDVLPATHDGRRAPVPRAPDAAPALGFRLEAAGRSCWFPGDTGLRDDFAEVGRVDLAVVPIGGWGPSLGDQHLDPEEAAEAVSRVGARWALAVHYGTFWPVGLRRLDPGSHRHWYLSPPRRFRAAVRDAELDVQALTPAFGERLALGSPGGGR